MVDSGNSHREGKMSGISYRISFDVFNSSGIKIGEVEFSAEGRIASTINEDILFKPHPGFQTEYLKCEEKEVFSGGGRGGEHPYTWNNGNLSALDPLLCLFCRTQCFLINNLKKKFPPVIFIFPYFQ